ncbi:fatty acid desaturase [Phenylobacterium sp. LjRoot225]|uniref:fatty acid desaturase family protein n=1 Tax=Phenylobacterium sp. LjRoot225 TaxID=3342285 RepID=UPI003ECD5997
MGAKTQEELPRAVELVAEAQRLTADLTRPNARIYWTDLLLTAAVLYSGFALAVLAHGPLAWAGGVVCALALYRGVSFIHELTHLRSDQTPGFRAGWNVLIGVPFLAPSLLYEGVHNLHHLRQLYGTPEDPEYLPLSRRRPIVLAGFLATAALAPLGAFLRFAVLAPLSFVIPSLRSAVIGRFSAMSINPAFRRQDVAAARRPAWRAQEIACWLWSWALIGLVAWGGLAARVVLTGVAIMALMAVVNQLRTLVAHSWTSDGKPMSVTDQFLDSVNVPPPGWLPLLWAPVGLRYHALHHLLPGVPYHGLAEAHRRLVQALPETSAYHRPQHRSLFAPLRALIARSSAYAGGPEGRA